MNVILIFRGSQDKKLEIDLRLIQSSTLNWTIEHETDIKHSTINYKTLQAKYHNNIPGRGYKAHISKENKRNFVEKRTNKLHKKITKRFVLFQPKRDQYFSFILSGIFIISLKTFSRSPATVFIFCKITLHNYFHHQFFQNWIRSSA